jgi:hypothetical protein
MYVRGKNSLDDEYFEYLVRGDTSIERKGRQVALPAKSHKKAQTTIDAELEMIS